MASLEGVFQWSFRLGSEDSVGFPQRNWRKKGGCVLWAFLLNTSHSTSSCLSKLTLQHTEDDSEMRFPSISNFVFLLDVWSIGEKKWWFGYKTKCMWVSFGQDRLHPGRSARLVISTGKGHLEGRTVICHKLCHLLGVNGVLSILIKCAEEKAWPRLSSCVLSVSWGLHTGLAHLNKPLCVSISSGGESVYAAICNQRAVCIPGAYLVMSEGPLGFNNRKGSHKI